MITEQITRNGTEVGIAQKQTDASGVYICFYPTSDHAHPISFKHKEELNTYLDSVYPENEARHGLADRSAILDYLIGGHGTFTILNTHSGCRYTFKVSTPADAEGDYPRFVAVLTGSDNTSDYQYLGQFRVRDWKLVWSHGRKSSIKTTAKSALSDAWFFNALNADALPSFLEVIHEGTCCRCGRKLTTPESIEAGIGPVCATKD